MTVRSAHLAVALFVQLFWSASSLAAEPLACGVEGTQRALRAADVCKALARELGRPTTLVDDARKVKHGDALHVVQEDVQWIVVWLADGHVRSWTRVSKIEANDDQLRFIVRAARALSELSPPPPKQECVRVEPEGRNKARTTDLVYPWSELRACRRRFVEVVDPWWLPETTPQGRRRPAS